MWWMKKGLPNPSQGFQFLDFHNPKKEKTKELDNNDEEA
tara:strand:+ start:3560 stop:3676 length:117 start_codon:yes stop_codon:yes gene_type:complete